MLSVRRILWVLVGAVALVLGMLLAIGTGQINPGGPGLQAGSGPAASFNVRAEAPVGGPFALTGPDGRRVTEADFAGQYRIVYFGYTFCPDVCPVDAQAIGQGLKLFEKRDAARAAKVTPIFITVDPARDTPAVVKAFTANFHSRMVGLTGSEADIEAVKARFGARQARVFAQKAAGSGNSDAYLVDHTRFVMLFGPDGEGLAFLDPPDDPRTPEREAITPQIVAEALDKWVK